MCQTQSGALGWKCNREQQPRHRGPGRITLPWGELDGKEGPRASAKVRRPKCRRKPSKQGPRGARRCLGWWGKASLIQGP